MENNYLLIKYFEGVRAGVSNSKPLPGRIERKKVSAGRSFKGKKALRAAVKELIHDMVLTKLLNLNSN